MLQYTLIAVRNTVMSFVNDDRVKIKGVETVQTFLSHQCLHRTNYYAEPASLTGTLCFFKGTAKTGCLHQFICGLFQQLPSVCQDQNTVSLPDTLFCYFGKDYRLSTSSRKDQQGF